MNETVQGGPVKTADVPLRQLLWEGLGARLVATYWGGVVVVDLTPTPRGFLTVAGIAALVAVCSVHQDRGAVVAIAGTGWLFVVGFVSNAHGELAPHGWSDFGVLGLLLVVAAGAGALTLLRGK